MYSMMKPYWNCHSLASNVVWYTSSPGDRRTNRSPLHGAIEKLSNRFGTTSQWVCLGYPASYGLFSEI
jgi:hypothetical protein